MFDNRQGHAEDVGFLERAFADHGLGHLAGDGDQRHGIHVGVGDAGDEVGRARPAGGHADAGPAGGAGVAAGGEGPALLVARQNGADGGAGQGLMDFHAGAAGIGENTFHPLAFQGPDQDVAALHDLAEFRAGARTFSEWFVWRLRFLCSYTYVAGGRG